MEVFGVVGLALLADVLLYGEVEDGDQEVDVRDGLTLPGVVIPEVLVFFINTPYLSYVI